MLSYFAYAVLVVIGGLLGVMVGLAAGQRWPALVQPPVGAEEPWQLSRETLEAIARESEAIYSNGVPMFPPVRVGRGVSAGRNGPQTPDPARYDPAAGEVTRPV